MNREFMSREPMKSVVLRAFLAGLLTCLLPAGFAQTVQPAARHVKAPVKVAETQIPLFHVWQQREGVANEIQVTQTQLNPGGYWLLAYVDRHADGSDALLKQLENLTKPSPAGKPATAQLDPAKLVIVVARATGAQLSAMELEHPILAAAAWTHDENGAAANALHVHGVPHMFGMHAGLQRWQFAGALHDNELQPMVMTWLGYNRLGAGILTRSKPPAPPAAEKATVSATPQGAKQ